MDDAPRRERVAHQVALIDGAGKLGEQRIVWLQPARQHDGRRRPRGLLCGERVREHCAVASHGYERVVQQDGHTLGAQPVQDGQPGSVLGAASEVDLLADELHLDAAVRQVLRDGRAG
jgi:hypothetical protein